MSSQLLAVLAHEREDVLTRAITKTPITLWALLVWAYKRQMVQYERDRAIDLRSAASGRPWEKLGASRGYGGSFLGAAAFDLDLERGCINGAGTTAHIDAHRLHRHVWALGSLKRHAVILFAEIGLLPVWNPTVAPLRIVPLWKGPEGRIERSHGSVCVMGKLLKMYPGQRFPGDEYRERHEHVGHWVVREGFTDDEAAAIRSEARDLYSAWWNVLAELHGNLQNKDAFERWKLTDIGVPREPWNDPR